MIIIQGPANIVKSIVEVIEAYEIGEKLGYCMLDNTSNNTTAIEELNPLLIGKFRIHTSLIQPEER